MKIATIYTGKSLQLISNVENELKLAVKGEDLQIVMFSDPTIIDEIIVNLKVIPAVAQRLIKLYITAVESGAKIIYNICSSVGDVASSAKNIFDIMDVPLIRIDEEMVITAINSSRRIGVLGTLKTTLDPTKRLIIKHAEARGVNIEIIEALAERAFRKPQQEMDKILIEKARSISNRVDVILLAQASMAMSEDKIADATGKTVFSSPRFGAIAVSKAITKLKNRRLTE